MRILYIIFLLLFFIGAVSSDGVSTKKNGASSIEMKERESSRMESKGTRVNTRDDDADDDDDDDDDEEEDDDDETVKTTSKEDDVINVNSDTSKTQSNEISQSTVTQSPQVADLESPEQVLAQGLEKRTELLNFILENPNARSCRVSTYIQRFIDTHNLNGLPDLNLEQFQKYLKEVDPVILPDQVEIIHPFYISFRAFINNLKSRNKLVSFLKSNSNPSMLEISSIMEEFLEGHKLLDTSDEISLGDFIKLMKNRDNYISGKQINMIYPVAIRYLAYYRRAQARDAFLLAVRSDPNLSTASLFSHAANFGSAYNLPASLASKEKAVFELLVKDKDHFIYPEDIEELYKYYVKYVLFATKYNTKKNLLTYIDSLGSTSPSNIQIYENLFKFMEQYELMDKDISSFDVFSQTVSIQDDSITAEEINKIYSYAIRFKAYNARKKLRTDFQTYIEKHSSPTNIELMPYIVPYMIAFDLETIIDEKSYIERIKSYDDDAISQIEKWTPLFSKVSSFKEFYLKRAKFTELITYIRITPTLAPVDLNLKITNFLSSFGLTSVEIYLFDDFVKEVHKFDQSISIKDLEYIHPYIKTYKISTEKKTARDNLKEYLNVPEKDRVSETLNSLIDKIVDIYELNDEHVADASKFIARMKIVDIDATDGELSPIYKAIETRMQSEQFKSKMASRKKILKPGDFDKDGNVVPPTDGIKLGWFKIFKFFGLVPYFVQEPKTLAEMFVLKRWWNAIYLYLTGLNYFCFPNSPLVQATSTDATEISTESIQETGDQIVDALSGKKVVEATNSVLEEISANLKLPSSSNDELPKN